MAAKYEQSAANFARVVAAHRDIVRSLSQLPRRPALKRAPLRGALAAAAEGGRPDRRARPPACAPSRCGSTAPRSMRRRSDGRRRCRRLPRRRLLARQAAPPHRAAGRAPARPRAARGRWSRSRSTTCPASAAETGAAILERRGLRGHLLHRRRAWPGRDARPGRMAERRRRVERLAAAGHEIGCHTYSHLDCGQAGAPATRWRTSRATPRPWPPGASPRPATFAYPYGDVAPGHQARRWPAASRCCAPCTTASSPPAPTSTRRPAVGVEGPDGEALAMRWLDRAAAPQGLADPLHPRRRRRALALWLHARRAGAAGRTRRWRTASSWSPWPRARRGSAEAAGRRRFGGSGSASFTASATKITQRMSL